MLSVAISVLVILAMVYAGCTWFIVVLTRRYRRYGDSDTLFSMGFFYFCMITISLGLVDAYIFQDIPEMVTWIITVATYASGMGLAYLATWLTKKIIGKREAEEAVIANRFQDLAILVAILLVDLGLVGAMWYSTSDWQKIELAGILITSLVLFVLLMSFTTKYAKSLSALEVSQGEEKIEIPPDLWKSPTSAEQFIEGLKADAPEVAITILASIATGHDDFDTREKALRKLKTISVGSDLYDQVSEHYRKEQKLASVWFEDL